MEPGAPNRRRRASGSPQEAEAICSWLTRHLRTRRCTIRQLASLTGVHYSALSRILRREASPRWSTIERLVAVLGDYPIVPGRLPVVAPVKLVADALEDDPVLAPEDRTAVLRFYLRIRRVGRIG